MNDKVLFCLVLHNHQPVGNFSHVYEKAMESCYRPFLDMLDRYPDFKVSLHLSGSLFDWIEENRPEYIDRLGRLVDDGRVELIGGGYYEPILNAIPFRDAVCQMEMMREYLDRRFGVVPNGIWLTERIWEPGLPALLAKNKVLYTLLDESHFRSAGVPREDMVGHFVSERHANKINVFPIRKELRYAIPFAEPERTLEVLRHCAETHPGTCVTYGDDGEKFGIWPQTYEWVYEKGWLNRFFDTLIRNREWVRTATLAEAFSEVPAMGRAYFPATSYLEMTEWALPTPSGIALNKITEELKNQNRWDAYEGFIRGGFWDNFLVKYSESNQMHKRMLWVSEKIKKCPQESLHTKLARRELMMGQCNCAYWHGLFGGTYLNYLRDAVTRHLARAESYADLLLYGGSASIRTVVYDFDADGFDEIIMESPWFRAVVKPSDGAVISELVVVKKDFCITNVLTRRPETYHERVRLATMIDKDARGSNTLLAAKEEGLADYLTYDSLTRATLRDRLFESLPPFDEHVFDQARVISDHASAAFPFETFADSDKIIAELSRLSPVSAGGVQGAVELSKRIEIRREEPCMLVSHRFVNRAERDIGFTWALEFNLTLLARGAPDRWIMIGDIRKDPGDRAEERAELIELFDGWQKLRFSIALDAQALVRQYPIETVSQSESGFERIYQGTCLLVLREVSLGAGQALEFRTTIRYSDLE